ncbi:MAG: ABC transporter ATP-binding protein [Lachnospiraceae bacterium]|jgi:ATP-binding cassette subfamily B protein|nr:ABC transporter ATP-binding protein [Lachnospiraceae bacterium]
MKDVRKTILYAAKIVPMRMIVYFLLTLPTLVLPVFMLKVQKDLVDLVSDSSEDKIKSAVILVFILLGLYLVNKVFDMFSKDFMEFGYFRYINLHMQREIHKKMELISLENYENVELFQLLERGQNSAMYVVFTASVLNLIVQAVVLVLMVSAYLCSIYPILFIFIIFVAFPVLIEKILVAKKKAVLLQANSQFHREMQYYKKVLSDTDSEKELKVQGAGHYFYGLWKESREKQSGNEKKIEKDCFRISCGYHLIQGISHGIAFAIILVLLIYKKISIGEFSVLLSSFAFITANLSSIMSFMGEIAQAGELSKSYFDLLELEIEDGTENISKEDCEICFQHVSYTYPGREKRAVSDISFTLKKKESLAIVGVNGSGKSTLVKLMTGMLKPKEGICVWGKGKKRDTLKERSILEHISAAFQIFGKYKLSVKENLIISSPEKREEDKIEEALKWADLDLKKEMVLGREFGGEELSGGQWQRIALARCYYRDREIVFVDEPTSAIDPLEELNIYQKLLELTKDKTVVVVTHRLGVAKNVDKILVLEDGKLVETGTFDELQKMDGVFAKMWEEQAKWYRREEIEKG